jgi:DNA-binding response OmpR family regulator
MLRASEVWERIRARIERTLLVIDVVVCARFERDLSDEERADAGDRCERLASWLGRLGLVEAAELTRQLRDGFVDGDEVGGSAPALAGLCDDLRTVLAVTAAGVDASERDSSLLLIVGPESDAVDSVLWVACMHGLRVAHYSRALPPATLMPACVYVPLDTTRVDVGRTSLRAVAEQFAGVPIVVSAPRLETADRLRLAKFATAVIPDATPPIEVVVQVRGVLARAEQPLRIALAGNSAGIGAALTTRGFEVRKCRSVQGVVELLRSGAVRGALVVDGHRAVDALSLVRVVRSDPQLRHAPVSVLGDVNARAEVRRRELLRAGADDVWPGSITPDELSLACRNRLRRVADIGLVPDFDQQVASFPEAHATLLIERMLVAALRRTTTASVAVLRPRATLDPDRAAEFAERLAREFRREDVVGRFADRFVIALQGVGRGTAVRRFEGVLRRLDADEADARVGVAEFPLDGRSVDELLHAADEAIARAEAVNGPAVVSPDWRPEGDRAADVLIVDPDPMMRELLGALLERASYRVELMDDGAAVYDRLTKTSRDATPRLLLTELDLTGIDGLQLLHRLRDAGIFSRMRVAVLTARVHESELAQALELGAADIITKPFSPMLLVHRISKVLAS